MTWKHHFNILWRHAFLFFRLLDVWQESNILIFSDAWLVSRSQTTVQTPLFSSTDRSRGTPCMLAVRHLQIFLTSLRTLILGFTRVSSQFSTQKKKKQRRKERWHLTDCSFRTEVPIQRSCRTERDDALWERLLELQIEPNDPWKIQRIKRKEWRCKLISQSRNLMFLGSFSMLPSFFENHYSSNQPAAYQ